MTTNPGPLETVRRDTVTSVRVTLTEAGSRTMLCLPLNILPRFLVERGERPTAAGKARAAWRTRPLLSFHTWLGHLTPDPVPTAERTILRAQFQQMRERMAELERALEAMDLPS